MHSFSHLYVVVILTLYYCISQEPFAKRLRQTVLRQVNLSIVLTFRLVSTEVQSRFPSYQSLIESELITPDELSHLIAMEKQVRNTQKQNKAPSV